MAAPAPCGTAWAGKSGATFDSTRRQSQFAHSKWPDAVVTEHYMSDRAVPGVGCVVDGGRKGEIGSASFYSLLLDRVSLTTRHNAAHGCVWPSVRPGN